MMDTSEKYIEMCRKATKIQDSWKLNDGDYLYYPDINEVVRWLMCDDNLQRMPEDPIWLPQQDELYELHTPLDSKGYSAYGLARMFGIWLYARRDYVHKQGYDSMEQHLLAFVMWDVFEKRWNGSEWEMV